MTKILNKRQCAMVAWHTLGALMDRVVLDCCVKRSEVNLFPKVVLGDQRRNFDTSVFANTQYVSTQACKRLVQHYYNCNFMVWFCLVSSECFYDWYYACVASASCVCVFGWDAANSHPNKRQEIDELVLCLNGITMETSWEIKLFPSSIHYNFFQIYLGFPI